MNIKTCMAPPPRPEIPLPRPQSAPNFLFVTEELVNFKPDFFLSVNPYSSFKCSFIKPELGNPNYRNNWD